MGHYLITGGCGFIGSHLVERLLADEHAVRILDDLSTGRMDNVPSGMDLVVGDMREPGVSSRRSTASTAFSTSPPSLQSCAATKLGSTAAVST